MADNRCSCAQGNSNSSGRDTVCIDTYQVLDSCRDRDCYEDVRVILTTSGQETVNRTCNVRVKCAKLIWASVTVDPIQFNCGFYQINIRYYVRIICESCTANGKPMEFEGLAILDKRVVLFGSEGNVNVFKSSTSSNMCSHCDVETSDILPVGVVEVVEPVVLGSKVCDFACCVGYCCCSCNEIPEAIAEMFDEPLVDPLLGNRLYVSLGVFSVVRIERPAQYLITASDYCVPDKECSPAEDRSPCSIFKAMSFPTCEFCPQSRRDGADGCSSCRQK